MTSRAPRKTNPTQNMLRILFYSLLICLGLCHSSHAAKEILLRLAPEADAPVIAKVTASEKVLLDTAPAPINAHLGWRQLPMPSPFTGYVPEASLSKNFEIQAGTPVQYLPTSQSASITHIATGDSYEIVRVKEEWATVRLSKEITGYFLSDASQQSALDLQARQLSTPPAPSAQAPAPQAPAPQAIAVPEPVAIPVPRTQVNPDQPIAQLDPNTLPPENVAWQPATAQLPSGSVPHSPLPTGTAAAPAPPITDPIMVSPDQTQAYEAKPELGPAKAPRLLTGTLVREINAKGPDYPIRLISPEGRLIAYVDFSKIYINDLAPYLEQKVYLRGQIYPLPDSHGQLVIQAESLRLAD